MFTKLKSKQPINCDIENRIWLYDIYDGFRQKVAKKKNKYK